MQLKPPKPKGPPPPFEFKLDLPPEGAEVPFVKNYSPPPPEPEPVPVPEGGAWKIRSIVLKKIVANVSSAHLNLNVYCFVYQANFEEISEV